jgi:nucleoside-diphosphate-sugar epimerase
MQKNILMVHNFIASMPKQGIRSIVFLSSADVYGFPSSQVLPITEATLPEPTGYYGLSKLICEKMLQFKINPSCPVTVLRLAGVFGRSDNFQSMIGKFAKKIAEQQPLIITNDGITKRDYIEIDELCQIITCFLQKPAEGVFNVVTGKSHAVKEIVMMLAKELDVKPKIQFTQQAGERDTNLVFDMTKLKTKLKSACPGIKLKGIEAGIKKYVQDNALKLKK